MLELCIYYAVLYIKLYEHSTFIVSNPYLHHHNNNHNIEIKGKHMFCYAVRIESDNFLEWSWFFLFVFVVPLLLLLYIREPFSVLAFHFVSGFECHWWCTLRRIGISVFFRLTKIVLSLSLTLARFVFVSFQSLFLLLISFRYVFVLIVSGFYFSSHSPWFLSSSKQPPKENGS